MKLFLAIRLCLFKIIYQKVFLANNCWNWRPALICQFYLRSRNWLLLMQRSPLNSTGLHPKKAAISFRGCSHFMSAKFWFFLTSSLQCVKRPKNLTETKSKTSSSTKLFLIPIPGPFLAQIFFETGLDIIKKQDETNTQTNTKILTQQKKKLWGRHTRKRNKRWHCLQRTNGKDSRPRPNISEPFLGANFFRDWFSDFLAAVAALYLTLVTEWVGGRVPL